jgi:hypothetical protein
MSQVERTAAGLQMVIPGCESRTLPKSGTRADETGQGVLHFYNPQSWAKSLQAARVRLWSQGEGKRRCQRTVCSFPSALVRGGLLRLRSTK